MNTWMSTGSLEQAAGSPNLKRGMVRVCIMWRVHLAGGACMTRLSGREAPTYAILDDGGILRHRVGGGKGSSQSLISGAIPF
jgi:hypothetical protein